MNAVLASVSGILPQCTVAIRKAQFSYKTVTIHIHFKSGHIWNFHIEINGEIFLRML